MISLALDRICVCRVFDAYPNFSLALVTARLQVFQQQLIFGDPLYGFDEERGQWMLDLMFTLQILEVCAAVLHHQRVRLWLVFAIMHVHIEL